MFEGSNIDIIFFNAVPQASLFNAQDIGCFFLYACRLFQGVDNDPFLEFIQPMVKIHFIGKNIGFVYLPVDMAEGKPRLEVEIFGETVTAEVAADILYDPEGNALRK